MIVVFTDNNKKQSLFSESFFSANTFSYLKLVVKVLIQFSKELVGLIFLYMDFSSD